MAHPSFFFIACTEVNAYLAMKYFLKTDDAFMNFWRGMAKALIKKSYTNGKTCGSTENVIKRKLSHILKTAPCHATEYNEKNVFSQKNINTNNTSAVGQNLKTHTNVLLVFPGNMDLQRTSTYECSGESCSQ